VGITDAGTSNNTVAGNYIGTDASGAAALGNGRYGVNIFLGAQGNQVGGATAALSNTIAFNGLAGVQVLYNAAAGGVVTTGNRIQGNSIYSNQGLGIDLSTAPLVQGVTPNDLGDGDSGPNNLQNFPVINVAHSGPKTFVSGTLNSLPDTVFTLDFYASPFSDYPSGYGEGARYLGSTTVGTDGAGNNGFQILLNAATSAGEWITATATEEATGNPCEFSHAERVTDLIVAGTIGDEQYVFGRHETGAIEVFVYGVSQGVAAQIFVFDPDGQDSYAVNFAGWSGSVTISDFGT